MEKNRVNIIEVARRAEVSVATVSRVLNGVPTVKAETRNKVQRIIDELGYVPSAGAREMGANHSMNIGVIVPSVYNMFFAEVLDGIEDYLRNDSYTEVAAAMPLAAGGYQLSFQSGAQKNSVRARHQLRFLHD